MFSLLAYFSYFFRKCQDLRQPAGRIFPGNVQALGSGISCSDIFCGTAAHFLRHCRVLFCGIAAYFLRHCRVCFAALPRICCGTAAQSAALPLIRRHCLRVFFAALPRFFLRRCMPLSQRHCRLVSGIAAHSAALPLTQLNSVMQRHCRSVMQRHCRSNMSSGIAAESCNS